MRRKLMVYFFIGVAYCSYLTAYKIGLCIMATGKYTTYAQRLIESARIYFCKNHEVTYFVFTDGVIEQRPDVVAVFQKRFGWPYDTLMRFEVYRKHQYLFKDMDYLFALDADMLCVAPIGDEILSDLVGTIHPGNFYGNMRGSYETRPESMAYIKQSLRKEYFAGGFYGGKQDRFVHLIDTLSQRVYNDLRKNMIAKWHDESHLNWYFAQYSPTIVLSPSYCYQEELNLPFERKLLAIYKNHTELRV